MKRYVHALMAPVIIVLGMELAAAGHSTGATTVASEGTRVTSSVVQPSEADVQVDGSNIRIYGITCGIRMYGECALTASPATSVDLRQHPQLYRSPNDFPPGIR